MPGRGASRPSIAGMAYVLILQHVPVEGPGLIAAALDASGVEYRIRNLLTESASQLPPAADLCGLVLMGGPMDAGDVEAHPALALEQQLVRDAIAAQVPVLGVCLGHQIIALALGAAVDYGATREIGVGPVQAAGELAGLTGIDVLHWHTDNAGLPEGAELLAHTAGCPNQAFRFGSALGVQFHLELDEALLAAWLDSGMSAELAPRTAGSLLLDFARQNSLRQRVAGQIFGQFSDQAQALRDN